MSVTRTVRPERERATLASAEIPPVPLTVEGYSVLHQMMRFRWPAWRGLSAAQKNEIVDEARGVLAKMEENASGQSGLFSLIGHKGDLMLVHSGNRSRI
jgi:chlorite dismutase